MYVKARSDKLKKTGENWATTGRCHRERKTLRAFSCRRRGTASAVDEVSRESNQKNIFYATPRPNNPSLFQKNLNPPRLLLREKGDRVSGG